MNRIEYIGLPGTFTKKQRGYSQPGLDFSRLIRDELRANGYPTKECTDVCSQPNICDLLTDCNLGNGGTTVTSSLTGQILTISVNGVGTSVTLPSSGGGDVTLNPATNPALSLVAGVLNLDLGAAGSYNNSISGLTATSITSAIDELDLTLDNLDLIVDNLSMDFYTQTYTNGVTKTGSDIELGGTLEHNTTVTAPTTFSFDVVKDNVQLLVSPSGFGSFGVGESVTLRGSGPSVDAYSGIYTKPVGNPSYATYVRDNASNYSMTNNFDLVLQAVRTIVGTIGNNITYESFIGLDKCYLGSFDSLSNLYTGFGVENFISPVTGVGVFLRNIPLFPDDATAAAALPKDAIWRDNSNNLKIVP